MRPRLSLHPEYHAGIGLDFYAQLSSPIRRYADLVLQRQLLGALANRDHDTAIYTVDELLTVLAGAENAEASGRELERRAKRYWILRYLERHARDGPILAYVAREGQSAELADFAVRGTLHGAPTSAESNADNGASEPRRSAARMARIRFRRPRRRSLNRRNQNDLIFSCHPERSEQRERSDMASGQLAQATAGSGFEIAKRSFADVVAHLSDARNLALTPSRAGRGKNDSRNRLRSRDRGIDAQVRLTTTSRFCEMRRADSTSFIAMYHGATSWTWTRTALAAGPTLALA